MDLPPELIKVAAEFKDLLREIYTDLAKPGVQQAGKGIGTVIGLGNTILLPVQIANERSGIWARRNLDKYRAKLEDIPLEEIVEVPPEVGVPILEKLSYVSNEELSDMYVNLLAQSSTKHGSNYAHPSFVNVINNISPDEARIIQRLEQTYLPFHHVKVVYPAGNFGTILDIFIELENIELDYPNNLAAYMQNLAGLGVVEIQPGTWTDGNKPYYEKMEAEYTRYFEKYTKPEAGERLVFERCSIKTTKYGHMLRNACTAPSRSDS